MDYMTDLTSSLISALSIGHSMPETVWFWVKGALLFRMAVSAVYAFV